MRRERALKVVLVLVGSLFCAAIYPLMLMAKRDPALAMMMSLYVTLGVFLLLASRKPLSAPQPDRLCGVVELAHGCVMAVQASLSWIARRELLGVATFIVIALAPAKQPVERSSMVAA